MKKILIVFVLLLCAPLYAADLTRSDITVQVLIQEQTAKGQFNDALYLPIASYQSLSNQELDALKKQRVDNWLQFMANPPKPVEVTVDDLIIQLDSIQEQKQRVLDSILLKADDKQLTEVKAKLTKAYSDLTAAVDAKADAKAEPVEDKEPVDLTPKVK